MKLFSYWEVISLILNKMSDETFSKDHVITLKKVIEAYPCQKCQAHFQEYQRKFPMTFENISSKLLLKSYIHRFKSDIDRELHKELNHKKNNKLYTTRKKANSSKSFF